MFKKIKSTNACLIAVLAQEQNGLDSKRECVGMSVVIGLMCQCMHICTPSVGNVSG